MNRNKLELAGNLTRDPEVKYTPKGTAIVNFGIAVNNVYFSGPEGAKEKREDVNFFDCEAWGRTAENIAEYFKKGSSIFVDAKLKNESWDDKETGKKRYKLKIVVESFEFIGGKKSEATATDASNKPRRIADDAALDAPHDDIPF